MSSAWGEMVGDKMDFEHFSSPRAASAFVFRGVMNGRSCLANVNGGFTRIVCNFMDYLWNIWQYFER